MKKKVKMMLYGAPGVGKSTFALKFPKPFFITTDGNYEWLEDFGAKDEDHIQINSWKEFITTIGEKDFSNYDTIVVDLVEDLFQWAEHEFCKKNKIDYIGDLGFGKGFKITRDAFFLAISKLLSIDKNIILLSHESSHAVKDKRGVETTLYYPSKIIPENLRDQIEGRLRYVLRAKFKDVVEGTKVTQQRILSLASDSSEFGIIRGVDMSSIEEEIELDFDQFKKELKLDFKESPKSKVVKVSKPKVEEDIEDEEIEEEVKIPNPSPKESALEKLKRLKEANSKKVEEVKEEVIEEVKETKPSPAKESALEKLKRLKEANAKKVEVEEVEEVKEVKKVTKKQPESSTDMMERIREKLRQQKEQQGEK